jgi:hypothetical protein
LTTRKQRLRRLADAARVFALPLVQGRLQEQPESPITPFIGVRISWLMRARKSPRAREAAISAACVRRLSVTS